MQPPVIIFIGAPQVGKTEARKAVCQLTGLRGGSCSEVIDQFLVEVAGLKPEQLAGTSKEEMRPLKVKAGDFLVGAFPEPEGIPEEWKAAIDYRIPSLLIRTLYMAGRNVIDGVRRPLELQEARDRLEWNGIRHLTVWIDRPDAPKIADNTALTKEHADEVVVNDGTLEQLKERLIEVLTRRFPEMTRKVAAPPVLSEEQVKKLMAV
jgi:hypothetical protein